MPTEIVGGNPFSGLAQGGGGINVSGGGYNPPQANLLGAFLQGQEAAQNAQYKQQEIELAKAKLAQAQQEIMGKRMAGAFAARAYNPDTGTMDYNQLLTDIGSHPLTQPMFQDMYNDALKAGQVESETIKNRIAAAHDKAAGLGRAAYGLLEVSGKEGRDVEPAEVASAVMNNVTLGLLPMDEAKKIISNLPPKGPQLNNALKQFALEADQEAGSLKRVQGETAWEPSPQGGQQLVETGPGGQRTVLQQRPDVLGAEKLNEPMTIETTAPDGSKQTVQMTKRQWLERTGQTQNLPESAAGPEVNMTPPGVAPPPSARQEAESQATVTRNEAYKTDVQDTADQAGVRIGMLKTAKQLIDKTKTGGGADYRRILSRIAASTGAKPEYVNSLANGNLPALEELGGLNTLLSVSNFKNVTQQANRDLGQMEFERMQQAGFDINNTNETNKFVINYMLGTQELAQKRAAFLDKWENDGKPVEKFRTAWTKKERQLLERGILRDPDHLISEEAWRKGEKVPEWHPGDPVE